MNYKISTYADRVNGKIGFTLEAEGKVLDEKIQKFEGTNIKENALHCVYLGIKACSGKLQHNDLLMIEVQNIHLCEWLNGMVEYKGYDTWLDRVFGVLELLDCRYRFYFSKKPFCKEYMKGRGTTKVQVGSVDDMMAEFS